MDSNNREATSIQESVDTTQVEIYRAIAQSFMAIARHVNFNRSPPPVTIDLKRGQQKFQQYSQGFEQQNPSERTVSAARAAQRNGEPPEMVISLVRASPFGESVANSQGPANANLASAQIAQEATRLNSQAQHLKNNPGLAKSLKAKPIRAARVSRGR